MRNPFESRPEEQQERLNPRKKHPSMTSKAHVHDVPLGGGTENKVFSTTLRYDKSEKTVGGLVYKKLHYSDSTDPQHRLSAQHVLEGMERKWKAIKKVKEGLKERGERGFNIPGTVRVLRRPNDFGMLVTDLSQEGRRNVFDLKDLLYKFTHHNITPEDWSTIRAAVERDINIAIENGINLMSGPEKLDAWLVVEEDEGYEVYLSDIGEYISVTPYLESEIVQNDLELGKDQMMMFLDKVEQVLSEKWSKDA